MGDNKRMRVLFLSNTADHDGAGVSLLLLLRHLDKSRFTPVAVFPGEGPLRNEIEQLGIITYTIIPAWWFRSDSGLLPLCKALCLEALASPQLVRIVMKERIDLVYTNTMVMFSGAIASLVTRKPHIWHVRELVAGNPDLISLLPQRWLFRLIPRWSKRVIANSRATAAQFAGLETRGVQIIHNGVDLEDYPERPDAPVDLDAGTGWLVGVVGTLQKRKGQDDAIRAAAMARETIPELILLVVGEGNATYTDYLHELTRHLSADEGVVFTGHRNDVPELLPTLKALLVPSWEEPFGRVAIEAMAAGVPVVGTNAGGLKEIIQDGVTGFLVPPHDPAALKDRILFLHAHPAEREVMGRTGKSLVRESFDVRNHARKVEQVMAQALRERKG